MAMNTTYDRSIWYNFESGLVEVIDQRRLPFETVVCQLGNLDALAGAIRDMTVRGAPLIGVTAAYGVYLGLREGLPIETVADTLLQTRPTAVNLRWALERQAEVHRQALPEGRLQAALDEAHRLAAEDVAMCSAIGDHGVSLLEAIYRRENRPVNVLTHCNAGWLATVQWGTATAPAYKAHQKGIPVHVWIDETRPRNQGARLTAWELHQAGIPHTVIADNTGGHLMQHGMVDIVLVGSDRTTAAGDVCNKIGTYLKALAARDNDIPFYAALPASTIDWTMKDGRLEIPIEERPANELTHMPAWVGGRPADALLMAENTPVANYAFDVTPARLVTGIITERGICEASAEGLGQLYGR